MLIETDSISAHLYSAESTINLNKCIALNKSNIVTTTINNASCDPFSTSYCTKYHKHHILQVADGIRPVLAYNAKVNRKKVISLARSNCHTINQNRKPQNQLNSKSSISTKRKKSIRSFPVSDSFDSATKNKRNHTEKEREINNTKVQKRSTVVGKKNKSIKHPTGNSNDFRSNDKFKPNSNLAVDSRHYRYEVIANTFGKCDVGKSDAVELTPPFINNNSEVESSASTVKRRFSTYRPVIRQSQLLYYKNRSLDVSTDTSRVSSQTIYANINSSDQNFHSPFNSYNFQRNLDSSANSIVARTEVVDQRNSCRKTKFADNKIYPINNDRIISSAISTKSDTLLTSTNTNNQPSFTNLEIPSSSAFVYSDPVSTKKHEEKNTNEFINANPESKIYLKSLSLDPNEITVKNYLKATRDYIDTLIYLVRTEVLSMGKIQDLKDKVGANHIEMPQKDIWKCLGAEFLGTTLLVLIGCGSGVYMKEEDKGGLIAAALCWGLIVASLAQSLGGVSGCHINPAITLAMLVTGKIQLVKAGLYMIAQCLGATIGICILKALTPDTILGSFNPTKLHPNITPLQGFGIEVILTFTLATIVFGTGDENRTDILGSKPLAVGLTVSGLILFGGPLTGASLNPARTLGPSIVSGMWDNHWVYWLGPMSGAVMAGVLYQNVFRAMRPEEVETFEAEKETRTRQQEAKENGTSPPV